MKILNQWNNTSAMKDRLIKTKDDFDQINTMIIISYS